MTLTNHSPVLLKDPANHFTYPEPPLKGSAPPKEEEVKKEEGPGNPAKESANNPLDEKPPGTLGPTMEDCHVITCSITSTS